jgi:hypothetical protein
MPSIPSSTQTCNNLSLDNTALNALLYDVKHKTSPAETNVHQNKFYHGCEHTAHSALEGTLQGT